MTSEPYSLEFHPAALKEWRRLDASVREALKRKLARRIQNPVVESARLHGQLHDCFKLKNDTTGHRLIYHVVESRLVVLVLAVGARADLEAYHSANSRR